MIEGVFNNDKPDLAKPVTIPRVIASDTGDKPGWSTLCDGPPAYIQAGSSTQRLWLLFLYHLYTVIPTFPAQPVSLQVSWFRGWPHNGIQIFKESSRHRARAWQTSEWVGNSPLSFHPQGNSSYPILRSNVPASNFQLKMISDGPKSFSILLASPLPVLSIVLMGWEPSPNCSSLKVLWSDLRWCCTPLASTHWRWKLAVVTLY